MKTLQKSVFPLVLCLLLLASCQRAGPEPSASSGSGAELDPSVSSSTPAGAASSGIPPQVPEPKPEPVPESESPQEPDPAPPSPPEPEPESGPEPGAEAELGAPPVQNNTLHILMYHHLVLDGQDCNTWTVTNSRFQEDLQWLAGHGYTTVLPRELAAGEPLPEKAVMLTLDDGYESNYWLAFPLLKEFQAKAAIALITSHIDEGELYYLNWNQCREMAQSGLVEFGSHTHAVHGSEYGGIKRAPEETREEYEARIFPDLQTSIDLMEEHLEVTPLYFAYPLGKTEPWADAFLRDRFSVTVTTHHGSASLSQGLYCMNRYTVEMGVTLDSILPE